MKTKHSILFLCIFIMAATSVCAAPWDKSARIERAISKYKLDKVEAITGTVTKVYEKVPSFGKKKKDALGFHVVINDGNEKIDIHLGPTWYLKSLENRIAEGDVIEAIGSTVPAGEKDGKMRPKQMRAGEIRKNGTIVMKLRDENGRPVWSGTVFSQPPPPAVTEASSTAESSQKKDL